MGTAGDGIATDANAGGLAKPVTGELPDGLVGERAAATNDTDVSGLMNVAGSDADATATARIFACSRCDDARAVWADKACSRTPESGLDLDHVAHGDAFGDCDDKFESGIGRLQDCVCREWGRDEYRGCGCAGLLNGFLHAVENRHLIFKFLTGFTGGDAGDYL